MTQRTKYTRKKEFKLPWERDGYKSHVHYLADSKKAFGMVIALKENYTDHPHYKEAVEAKKLGLL